MSGDEDMDMEEYSGNSTEELRILSRDEIEVLETMPLTIKGGLHYDSFTKNMAL